jgi:mxaL protein
MIAYRDWRFWLRLCALAAILASLVIPKLNLTRPVYDLIAVLDITGSMNVTDQTLDGAPATRLALEKRALRTLLAELPCGSRLGVAIFVETEPFLLFEPVETCGNFAPLDQEIDTITWRMGWDSESHIADALRHAMQRASTLGADLIFMTDGQETPPLWWSGMPDFAAVRGRVQGLILGIGGTTLVPIPKFDSYGRPTGFFKPGDLPPERDGLFRGREYLSAVDEPHLKRLAGESGLTYLHLDTPTALWPAIAHAATPRPHAAPLDLAWLPAGFALLLLAATGLPPQSHLSAKFRSVVEKVFFFEKKKQKTFTRAVADPAGRARDMN